MNDYVVTSGNNSRGIKILDEEFVLLDGIKKKYSLTELSSNKYLLAINNKIFEVSLLSNSNDIFDVFVNQKSYQVKVLTSLQDKALKLLIHSGTDQSHQTKIKSPMPGLVLKINKNIGDGVTKGETVIVLEAMKMENEIKAPIDGEIAEINIKQGTAIEKNILLFVIK
ncbi:MAG: acetyl-CoA carboxylase biotin carboxyl carrier protein subunit [Ignavibacteriaceae bacterium]